MSCETFLEGVEAESDFLGYVYLRTVLFLQETLRCSLHEIFKDTSFSAVLSYKLSLGDFKFFMSQDDFN